MSGRSTWLAGALLGAGLALAGCAGDGSTLGPDGRPFREEEEPVENGGAKVTLAQLSAEVFAPSCAFVGCHGGSTPASNLSLEAARLAAELVGVASVERPDLKRVEPGKPERSYLLMKLRGDSGITGQQMPLGSPRLADPLIEKVRLWIAAGAPVE